MNPNKCQICVNPLYSRHARPSNCQHAYHVECLMDWTASIPNGNSLDKKFHCSLETCQRNYDEIIIWQTMDEDDDMKSVSVFDLICPVCLLHLKNDLIVKLDVCNHYYCFECVFFWCQQQKTCPMDRLPFNSVELYSCVGGRLILTANPDDLFDRILTQDAYFSGHFCEYCFDGVRDIDIATCQSCLKTYHKSCLEGSASPSSSVWYCPTCTRAAEGRFGRPLYRVVPS